MQEQVNTNLEAIKKNIVEFVTEHWRTTNSALLLSRLGVQLAQMGFDVKRELAGRKLAAFIESELQDKVTVVPSRERYLVVGAVPSGVKPGDDVEWLFDQPTKPPIKTRASTHIPRALWSGFVTPLAVDKVRTVDLKPKIRFQDVFEASATASGKLTIPREAIVDVSALNASEVEARVEAALSAWLNAQQLTLEQLTATDKTDANPPEEPRPVSPESVSLLERLIESLSSDELRRITIPLDVVAKLSNTR